MKWRWLLLLGLAVQQAGAAWVWIEGEQPAVSRMNRHPWYDQVRRDQLSGGAGLSNFSDTKAGEAEYRFEAPAAGAFDFWLRANPVKSKLAYQLNDDVETPVDFTQGTRDQLNIAADGKPDLRFIAWTCVGKVTLRAGANTIRFRMTSQLQNHGLIDCFLFTNEPFVPRGALKPDQMAGELKRLAEENAGWFAFDPPMDNLADSAIDLRRLNEHVAGEHGFITVKDGHFISAGAPLRFWAVNGPPHELTGAALRQCARLLASRGVNLVRVHGGLFDAEGELDAAKVRHAQDIVAAMKAEGIYTHFSIYFPLWLTPRAGHPWLEGYGGSQHPFAALLFNPKFQAKYRTWLRALVEAVHDDPAVFGIELQNEDSFFFWTFDEKNVPDPQLRLLEKRFGDWLQNKYSTLDTALARWPGKPLKRDDPAAGRVAFRPLWNMFNERTLRDQDTAAFLLEVQTQFYADTYRYLRGLGFKGVITASNWSTASPEIFGPLEKLSYAATDFIDRHDYFSCDHKGDNAAWSIRNGHTYADRSALRFEAEQPGRPKQFVHPVMDPHYADRPSMISETTFCRPNRFRSEAPLYYACYGALQDSDALIHFAFDSDHWAVKPGFFMQPWTLMTPAMMGQFPAAALLYRSGLVAPGAVLADLRLNRTDLLQLKGTPLPQDAALDELRLKDVPATGAALKPGQRLDPLLHYAGRASVRFTDEPGRVTVADLRPLIDHAAQTVISSTGELKLDYGKGVLVIDAAGAQGISGALRAAGAVSLRDLTIASDLELGHIVAVALDARPLASSERMLLQVMSEEKATDFQTENIGGGLKRIVNIGRDPWLVKNLAGTVTFKRGDAARLKATPLDFNGRPAGPTVPASPLHLRPTTVYYLITCEVGGTASGSQ